MKGKALIWFTGVISQYNVAEEYNIKGLNLNKGILKRLQDNYDCIFLIYVKDNSEKLDYLNLLKLNNLSNLKLIFASYNDPFKEILYDVKDKLGNCIMIDYSKKRLNEAALIFGVNNTIHISRLID